MLEPDNPSSSSSSAAYRLCGLGEVAEPLWASVSKAGMISAPPRRALINNPIQDRLWYLCDLPGPCGYPAVILNQGPFGNV